MQNFEEISIGAAQRISSPNPFGLLTTRNAEKTNIMAISWWTYLSNHPPMLATALSQRGFSTALIQQSGNFTLCLPSGALREKAFACGTTSGRQTDKIAAYDLALVSLHPDYPPCVLQSGVAFLCQVTETVTVGDHLLFIAEIKHLFADQHHTPVLHASDGYATLT